MLDRRAKLTWSKFKAGWIVTAGLMIVFITIFFLGTIRNWFVPQALLSVKVKNVAGLRNGAPVWLLGVQVGTVKTIELRPDGSIIVASIDKSDMKYIHRNAYAVIRTMGLLGDMYMAIEQGTTEAGPLRPGAVIPGEIETGFKEIMAISAQSIQKVDSLIRKLEEVLDNVLGGKGFVAQLMENPELYRNLNQAVAALSSLLKEISVEKGTLQLMLTDPALYNRMLSTTKSFQTFGQKLEKGAGTLDQLVEDPSLYEKMTASVDRLSAILKKIDRGQGLAGEMVTNDKLSTELQQILASTRELIEDIKRNPRKYFSISIF